MGDETHSMRTNVGLILSRGSKTFCKVPNGMRWDGTG